MADRQKITEFVYHDIELYKSKSLGRGSYGAVCKAKCDGLLCAAKIMHPTLFDLHDPGTSSYLSKFREECHLLSLARHPNVVQYLGTYTDSETQLPVLLMELCEESLTSFLERSTEPLSFHLQVNICHDIALALVYLHSNSLIHRDLTGNNVLMIAGPRAKVTDFGMSKLAHGNPRMTALTLCPGNVLYMSPEALDEAKSYTAKLDMFSFGVIVIQILTRQFPKPTDRFRVIESGEREIREVIPETERRAAHLGLIRNTHSLKPLALQCLKKEVERYSAMELSEKLSELKKSPLYAGSKSQLLTNTNIKVLQLQLQKQQTLTQTYITRIAELRGMVSESNVKLEEVREWVDKACNEVDAFRVDEEDTRAIEENKSLSDVHQVIEQKNKTIVDLQQVVAEYEKRIQQLEQQDTTITDLQNTVAAYEEKIQKLEKKDMASRETPLLTQVKTVIHDKYIDKMRWRRGKNAPEEMIRGAAVANGSTIYFRSFDSVKVYSYKNIFRDEEWNRLPDNPHKNFGLVFVDGLLTSVGGQNTNRLLSLTAEGKWVEQFPPLPTYRQSAACISTQQQLVVAGGFEGGSLVPSTRAEVMNLSTKQWSAFPSLPQACVSFSITLCGDTLYMAGGYGYRFGLELLKSVYMCSMQAPVWRGISSLPVTTASLASFGNDLVAVGGNDDSNSSTSAVYRYDPCTDSWVVASMMKTRRSFCLALSPSAECLVVVGGYTAGFLGFVKKTSTVEILS